MPPPPPPPPFLQLLVQLLMTLGGSQSSPVSMSPLPQTLQFCVSLGQAAEEPVQYSAVSHERTAGRHTFDDDRNESEGQVPEEPVQVSATSHAPASARQVVPEDL